MFEAKRTITRACRNIGLIRRPIECERNVSAVAFADDEHLMSEGSLVPNDHLTLGASEAARSLKRLVKPLLLAISHLQTLPSSTMCARRAKSPTEREIGELDQNPNQGCSRASAGSSA